MTEMGVVGGGSIAVVGPRGRVEGFGSSPRFDWWVGAEDRWHRAEVEAAVRQSIGADGSSVETRLRVPGGDVVHRVSVVPAEGSAVARVDITNETPVPVAVAVAVASAGRRIDVRDDTVSVDGAPVLRSGRPISRAAAADTASHLVATVEAANAMPPTEADLPFEAAHAAVLFPVPHTATIELVLAIDTALERLPAPGSLPSIDDVGRGWRLHLDGATRVSLPDERLTTALEAARRHLLAGAAVHPGQPYWTRSAPPWAPAVAAVALASWGHASVARDLLLGFTDVDHGPARARRPDVTGSLLWAWAELAAQLDDPGLVGALRPWIIDSVGSLTSRPRLGSRTRKTTVEQPEVAGWKALGLASAAPLLTLAGDSRSARDVVDALPQIRGEVTGSSVAAALGGHRLGGGLGRAPVAGLVAGYLGSPGDEPTFRAIGAAAGETGCLGSSERPHDPAASALLLTAVRRALVDEPMGPGGPVALFSGIDSAWLGAPMEVHAAPIRLGSVDAAVRWHGDRAALLWDTRLDTPVELTAPALDPDWRDERATGEALLSPTPSLEHEPGPESPAVRRGEQLDLGEDPGSFA